MFFFLLDRLERRFLERVAQSMRVNPSRVGNNTGSGDSSVTVYVAEEASEINQDEIPSPPWIRSPNRFQDRTGRDENRPITGSTQLNREDTLDVLMYADFADLIQAGAVTTLSDSSNNN